MQSSARRIALATRRGPVRAVHSSATASAIGCMHPPGDSRVHTVTVLPGHGCVRRCGCCHRAPPLPRAPEPPARARRVSARVAGRARAVGRGALPAAAARCGTRELPPWSARGRRHSSSGCDARLARLRDGRAASCASLPPWRHERARELLRHATAALRVLFTGIASSLGHCVRLSRSCGCGLELPPAGAARPPNRTTAVHPPAHPTSHVRYPPSPLPPPPAAAAIRFRASVLLLQHRPRARDERHEGDRRVQRARRL